MTLSVRDDGVIEMRWAPSVLQTSNVWRANSPVTLRTSRDNMKMEVRHFLSTTDAVILVKKHAFRDERPHHYLREPLGSGHHRSPLSLGKIQ